MSCGCKQIAKTVGKGVVGLTVSALGPTAGPEVIAERRATCNGCEHKKRGLQAFCGHPVYGDAEGGCGCYLPAKRRMRKKTCKKWKR
jgi:threonine dehydrogenase-like Zn-dependent dehydrogenase